MSQFLARLLLGLGGALVVAAVFLFGFWMARRRQMILLRTRHERGDTTPAPEPKGRLEVFVISFVSSVLAGILVYFVVPMLPVPWTARSANGPQAVVSAAATGQALEVMPLTPAEPEQEQPPEDEPTAAGASHASAEPSAMSGTSVVTTTETPLSTESSIATSPGVVRLGLGLSEPTVPDGAQAAGRRVAVSGATTCAPLCLSDEPALETAACQPRVVVEGAATTTAMRLEEAEKAESMTPIAPRVLVESASATELIGLAVPRIATTAAVGHRVLVEGAAMTCLNSMSEPELGASDD